MSESAGGSVCFPYVSDQAWNGVKRLAAQYDLKQIARLLDKLPAIPEAYRDNRPDQLRSHDLELLRMGRFPEWSYSHTRYPRHMQLNPIRMAKVLTICSHYHITDTVKPALYGNPVSHLGCLLEALGLGLLLVRGDASSIVTAASAEASRTPSQRTAL